jgi:hypothetical protein
MDQSSRPRLPQAHPLAGCEQKLWRAYEHFELLQREIRDLKRELKPATFRTEQKPDTQDTFRTVVDQVNAPPLRLAVIVGDMVHNLRSALDHLVFELAFLGLRGKRIPERTAFPVSGTRRNWNSPHVQNDLLAGVMQKHRAMLYRAQPCYGLKDQPTPATSRRRKRHPATDLNNLWNEDKHRMIQLAVAAPFEVKPSILLRDCRERRMPKIHVGFLARPLKEGTEVLTIPIIPTGPNPSVYVDIEVACEVCLRNGFPHRNLLPNIGNWVEMVIRYFEPVFETPHARRLWGLPRGSFVERELLRVKTSGEARAWTEGHDTPPSD